MRVGRGEVDLGVGFEVVVVEAEFGEFDAEDGFTGLFGDFDAFVGVLAASAVVDFFVSFCFRDVVLFSLI